MLALCVSDNEGFLFSEIDIQRCVQDSIKIFCCTPKSITYRKHENVRQKLKQPFESNRRCTGDNTINLDLVSYIFQ